MKGYYNIDKSLNNEDLKNKKVTFLDYIKNNLFYSNKTSEDIIRRNKERK